MGVAIVETLLQRKPITYPIPYIYTLLDWVENEASILPNTNLLLLTTENIRKLIYFIENGDEKELLFSTYSMPIQLDVLRTLLREPVEAEFIYLLWSKSIKTASELDTPALLSFPEVAIKKKNDYRPRLGKNFRVRSIRLRVNGVEIPAWRVVYGRTV